MRFLNRLQTILSVKPLNREDGRYLEAEIMLALYAGTYKLSDEEQSLFNELGFKLGGISDIE